MKYQNTKILKTILNIGVVGLVLFILLSIVSLPFVNKIFRINIHEAVWAVVLTPLGCFGIFILLALSWFISKRESDERSDLLKKFASQNSLTYTKQTTLPFLKEFNAYINKSTWLSSQNAMTGSSNNVLMGLMNKRNILVSDQIYTQGSGENSTTYEVTIVGIELREANLPFMSLYPESFSDKIFDGFSRCDIDYMHRPNFSGKYVLFGANETQIRNFFNDKILNFYEKTPPFTTICGGKYLVVYTSGLLNPAEITRQLKFLFTLANLFLKKY